MAEIEPQVTGNAIVENVNYLEAFVGNITELATKINDLASVINHNIDDTNNLDDQVITKEGFETLQNAYLTNNDALNELIDTWKPMVESVQNNAYKHILQLNLENDRRYSDLLEKNRSLDASNRELTKQNEEGKKRYDALYQGCNRFKSTLEHQGRELALLKRSDAEKAAQIIRIKEENTLSLEALKKKQEAEISAKELDKARVEAANAELSTQIAQVRGEFEEIKSNLSSITTSSGEQNTELTRAIQVVEAEKNKISDLLTSFQAEKAAAQQKCDENEATSKIEIERLTKLDESNKRSMEDVSSTLERQRSENESLLQKISGLENEALEYTRKITTQIALLDSKVAATANLRFKTSPIIKDPSITDPAANPLYKEILTRSQPKGSSGGRRTHKRNQKKRR